MIEEQVEVLKKQDKEKPVIDHAASSTKPRKPFGQKSSIQKLRDLDG